MSLSTYVDFRMNEWGMDQSSRRIQSSVRRVLNELHDDAHLELKDPRFEVMILPEASYSVWAYFPVYQGRRIAQDLRPKPDTRVLLVLSTAAFEREPVKTLEDYLRDHFGHILLYLRSPRAHNDCQHAQKERKGSSLLRLVWMKLSGCVLGRPLGTVLEVAA